MKKKIIILSGDPNSINSEIIFKSWKKIGSSVKKNIYIISNYKLLKAQIKKLKLKINITQVSGIEEIVKNNDLKVININLKFINPFKVSQKEASEFVIKSLNMAHKYGLNKNVKGIINCAINKNLLKKKKAGVTEFLASKCKVKNNSEVMLIWNKNFSVSPITTHIDIKDITKKLNIDKIVNKIKTINNWFKKEFNKQPRIAILGLNPHNSELRNNSEEKKIIIPAIKKLKKFKIKCEGPLVADIAFIREYKKFDTIVGMYHDQVLSPYKTIFKFNAINITLGLKYLRVSPDHGVAINLIGKNTADASSLIKCIQFVNKHYK
jgi:4-hydroxy-L-threonine phosphate dehydrogenase PdxA